MPTVANDSGGADGLKGVGANDGVVVEAFRPTWPSGRVLWRPLAAPPSKKKKRPSPSSKTINTQHHIAARPSGSNPHPTALYIYRPCMMPHIQFPYICCPSSCFFSCPPVYDARMYSLKKTSGAQRAEPSRSCTARHRRQPCRSA